MDQNAERIVLLLRLSQNNLVSAQIENDTFKLTFLKVQLELLRRALADELEDTSDGKQPVG